MNQQKDPFEPTSMMDYHRGCVVQIDNWRLVQVGKPPSNNSGKWKVNGILY